MTNLHLHLKFKYFDAIERGEKTEEYRLADKWLPRIAGRKFESVVLWRGYTGKKMVLPWRGWSTRFITHEHFGPLPVSVVCIPVWREQKA